MPQAKNKQNDLIQQIAEKTNLYNYQVKKVLIAFVQCVVSNLAQGYEVRILSLGKFTLKNKNASKNFNPYHQKMVHLKNRMIPKFIWGKRAYEFIKNEATENLIK